MDQLPIGKHLEGLAAGIRDLTAQLERERAMSRQYHDYGKALEQRLKDFEKAWADALTRDENARKMLAVQAHELGEAAKRYEALEQRRLQDCRALEIRIDQERKHREEETQRAAMNDSRARDAELKLAESRSISVRKDHEIRAQASRIEALRHECEALQGVLLSEKTGFKEIAERITDELHRSNSMDDFDSSLLDDLLSASQVTTIPSR